MKQLGKLGLVDLSENLKTTEYILKKKCDQMIKFGNLDYFSGAAGILNYFSDANTHDSDLNCLINSYLDKIISAPDFSVFKKENDTPNSGCINLGVPHGIIGAILLLLKLRGYHDADQLKKNVICHLLEKLFESKISGKSSILPSHAERGQSTLAWCYGDLPFLYCIIKTREEGIKDYSEEIEYMTEHTCKRRDCIHDNLSLCHGKTAIAYLYLKIWTLTQDKRCFEEFQYWKNESYKTWDKWGHDKNPFFENHSLFMGYPGFLVTMLTMEGELAASAWDSCLLL